ncbi:hypothetical protein [Nostoc sp.]|uniref:hypothetical protein n=1 Tax=Nostoc sp. TaxID=1180 RepID=UPI002FF6B221
MHSETERIFGTLQVILGEKLGFDLPDGQDAGYTSPFVWDASENGEFNILNLSQYKGWLKLTDADVTIRSWQQLEYLEYFPNFDYNTDVWKIITTQLQSLSDVLKNNSQVLESFSWKNYSDRTAITSPGLIVAEIEDDKWICVCPTVYKETEIPEEVISRSPLVKETFTKPFTETTLNLISKIEKITTDLGKIQ